MNNTNQGIYQHQEGKAKCDPRFMNFPDVVTSRNGNEKVLNTAENLAAMLKHLGYTLQKNAMTLEIEVTSFDESTFCSLDSIKSELISWSQRLGLPKVAIEDHIVALAEKNSVHPIKSWLDSGEWDGVNRVSEVISCLNAKSNVFAELILKKWLTGCVASLYEETFSSKLVPVLQGDQSFMKTSAISRICSVVENAFLEGAELDPDNKDSVLSVIKSFVVELGELERTSKNSQGSLKALITKSKDTVRPPYGRTEIHKQRQTSLIATVNGTDFLKDETGSSRYAVIELDEAINIDELNKLLGWSYQNGRIRLAIPELLKQFWLEIKDYYDNGHSWNLSHEQVKAISVTNEQHTDKGSYYEFLLERYVCVDDDVIEIRYFKAGEICQLEGIDKRFVRQVGQALKRLASEGKIETEKRRSNATYYGLKFAKQKADFRDS
ncbi:virulence-associated E family protein [Pseudoalteromonas sp. CNC9-20]|uniref:virulence-associated E family protein n=1 Tax=Pseudoalteromonas sp. CNC9-20 TaxID=2917750 RepID=UPI001EF67EB1|nr:virulence-associated E family protein [Pseudoalteromonas sp. CNC9-20]MCG7570769.1 virulence-associated E family protein [Pseudoalteromonas sp. CNC9-20]